MSWQEDYPDPFSIPVWDEGMVMPTGVALVPANDVISLPINPSLPFRKVYVFAELVQGGGQAAWFLTGQVRFTEQDGSTGPILPISFGVGDTGKLPKSAPSLLGNNQLFTNDSITVLLSHQFLGTTVTLNPFRVMTRAKVASFDYLAQGVDAGIGATQLRVFMLVMSANNPY